MKINIFLKKGVLLIAFTCFTSMLNGQTVSNYEYTGALQTYLVPAGVNSITIEAWGAEGGESDGSGSHGLVPAGQGGYAKGDLSVTPGQTLYIYVGGQGNINITYQSLSAGGWNGGGDGWGGWSGNWNAGNGTSGGGGGASDVRVGGTSLSDRVIVAGGGGGSDSWATARWGGDGGAPVGALPDRSAKEQAGIPGRHRPARPVARGGRRARRGVPEHEGGLRRVRQLPRPGDGPPAGNGSDRGVAPGRPIVDVAQLGAGAEWRGGPPHDGPQPCGARRRRESVPRPSRARACPGCHLHPRRRCQHACHDGHHRRDVFLRRRRQRALHRRAVQEHGGPGRAPGHHAVRAEHPARRQPVRAPGALRAVRPRRPGAHALLVLGRRPWHLGSPPARPASWRGRAR